MSTRNKHDLGYPHVDESDQDDMHSASDEESDSSPSDVDIDLCMSESDSDDVDEARIEADLRMEIIHETDLIQPIAKSVEVQSDVTVHVVEANPSPFMIGVPVALTSAAAHDASESPIDCEAHEEQLRQAQQLLSFVPDAAFKWDGQATSPVPLPIRLLYASGAEASTAQLWLQARFQQLPASLTIKGGADGPGRQTSELKAELAGRLHTWWNDRMCGGEADTEGSSSCGRDMWFYRLRKLVRDHLPTDAYKALGLDTLETRLKSIKKRALRSKAANTEATQRRQVYDTFVEAMAHNAQDPEEDKLFSYPIECNHGAIGAVLACLDPPTLLRNACTLRHICWRLGFLERVRHEIILTAPIFDERNPEFHSLASKNQCVFRLKELLRHQLTDQDYSDWWKSGMHRFCCNNQRYAVAQGIPGLAQLFVWKTQHEQTLKVVDDSGDCFLWNQDTRLWVEGGASQLDCEFMEFCRDVLSAEEGALHEEYLKSCSLHAKPDGKEEVTKDEMLLVMLTSARRLSQKIADGTLSSTFRKFLVTGLKDSSFRLSVNADAPDSFPLRGGQLIDLQTGQVRPRVSSDHFTFESPVSFAPGPASQRVGYEEARNFFFRICGGVHDLAPGQVIDEDQQRRALDMLRSLQVHLGYCLTGRNSEKKFMQHYGVRNTGKSTLWALLKKIMGSFITTVSPALIDQMVHKRSVHDHSAGFTPLFGARVVTCEEVPEGTVVNEALIKLISSGGLDSLPVRGCGEKKTQIMKLVFKLILVTNYKVNFSSHCDPACIDRALVYAFQTQFDSASAQSRAVAVQLNTPEFLDNVFAWLVEGAMMWYQLGETPACVISQEATQEYKFEQSPIDAFLQGCCEVAPANTPSAALQKQWHVRKDDLMRKCREWFDAKVAEGVYAPRVWPKLQELKGQMVARRFDEKQLVLAPHDKPRCFVGLRFKPEPQILQAEEPNHDSHAAIDQQMVIDAL